MPHCAHARTHCCGHEPLQFRVFVQGEEVLVEIMIGALHIVFLDLSTAVYCAGPPHQWNDRITMVKEKGVAAIVDGTADRWLTEGFRKTNPAADQMIRQMIARTSAKGFMACAGAVRDYDARKFFPEITCPVLIIGGTHDMAAPVAEFACVRDALKGATYLELNAAHLANIECESQYTQAVSQFLKANS